MDRVDAAAATEYACIQCVHENETPLVMPAFVDGDSVQCPPPTGCPTLQPGLMQENAVDYRYAPLCHAEMTQTCVCAFGAHAGTTVEGHCRRQPAGDLAWSCDVLPCLP